MLTTLQRLLPMAEKIIDRRSSLPILKHICITDGRAMFTDLESILMMPVPDTRSFTIPVGLLKKVLAAKPESLQFLVDDKKMVSILYGDKLVTYPGYDVDEYPLLPKEAFEPKGTWNWDIFNVLLTQSAYCSKDGLKPALNGVHVVQEDGQFKSESTDGHALRIQNGIDVGKSKALDSIIPTKPLALLARVARGNTKIGLSDTHLSFSLPGDVTLYVRTINEPYPAVMDVVPKKFTGEALLDRDKVLALIKAAGTKVELEVFDMGHVEIAKHLIAKGLIDPPPVFQLCLGIAWGMPATPANMLFMKTALPQDAIWAGFGVGPGSFPMVAQSALMGGNVRVGFEDNFYLSRGVPAKSNAQLVEKAVHILKALDKKPATARETREILNLSTE